MVTVQRANVILDVKESEVDRMVDLGYNVLDENGNIVKESMPSSITELQRIYREHVAKIAELEAEVEKLKATPVKRTTRKTEE